MFKIFSFVIEVKIFMKYMLFKQFKQNPRVSSLTWNLKSIPSFWINLHSSNPFQKQLQVMQPGIEVNGKRA